MTDSYQPRPPLSKTRSSADALSGTRKNTPDRVTLGSVLAALALSDRAREAAMRHFRTIGGSLDRFDGLHVDRERMLEALLVAEDVIEHDMHGRVRPYDADDRRALRRVRRALEAEVHP